MQDRKLNNSAGLDAKYSEMLDNMIKKSVGNLLTLAAERKNSALVVPTLISVLDQSKATDQTKELLKNMNPSLEFIYHNPEYLGFSVTKELQPKIRAYIKQAIESYIDKLSAKIDIKLPSFMFFVKELTGQSYSIEAEPSDTILAIKERITARGRVPIDQYRLIHAGQQLENTRTVADYNTLQNESTLHMVIQLRGD